MSTIEIYTILIAIITLLILVQLRLILKAKPSIRPQLIRQLILLDIGIWVTFTGMFLDNPLVVISGIVITIIVFVVQYYLRLPPGYLFAQKLLKSGDHQGALEQINKSIEKRPKSSEAHYLRSLIYLSQMQLAEARSDIAKIEELNPHSALKDQAFGQMFYLQGEYEKAKDSFNNACYSWSTQVCRGQLCYQLEEYEDAVKAFKAAILGRLPDEQKLLAYYYLGCSLEKMGRDDEANKAFDDMERYARGLDKLKQIYRPWSQDYPEIQLMQKDIVDIEELMD
jgi:tetratricopeptide (TPR) repeat protein